MVEKFDEWILNRQSFPYQNFAVLYIAIYYLEFVRDCHIKYIPPKKDPPEYKELYLFHLGHY